MNQENFDEKMNEMLEKSIKSKGWIKIWGPLLIAFFCYQVFFLRISPGEVGVVVNLFGSSKGVEEEELSIGVHFVPPWKSVYRFPVFEQNYQWVKEDAFVFQTSEGLSVKSEIGITFNLMQDKVHELFCKYRRGMEEITHLFIRNNVRDAVNRYAAKLKIEDLYGPKKEEFFSGIKEELNRELASLGFNISHIYIIGQFEVPDTVRGALNKKIEAIQRAQQRENELREAEAEARKEVATMEGIAKSKVLKAEADAKANDLVSKSLTKQLLEWEAIKKWDGKLPNALGGNNMPFLMSIKDKE
jgi:regulator of protease activity HflC (stomatin/prohibitin superfamily)